MLKKKDANPKPSKNNSKENLSESKKNQKQLLKFKDKVLLYERMFSKLGAFVFILDLVNYRFKWISDYHKKLLGHRISLKTHSSKDLLELFHPDDRCILNEMKSFFSKRKTGSYSSIYRIKKLNGEFCWVYTSANLYKKTNDNKTIEVIGYSMDFSVSIDYNKHLKQVFKEKLKTSNAEIVSRVSKRELEVLKYFANGYKTKEVAEELNISFHTVNNHRKNILKKLELRNLAAMVNFAVENSLD